MLSQQKLQSVTLQEFLVCLGPEKPGAQETQG